MDTADLITDYRASDFADAIRALLPKGDYWQEADNTELTRLINGMAADFKITHDEIELSLLTDFNQSLFGWKLSDYQALLNRVAGEQSGLVYDVRATPNLIYVGMNDNARAEIAKAWQAFEEKRLPHTEITWLYHSEISYHHQLANCRHIRNLHSYEVTQ